MLLERLFYPEDFPIRITVASLVEDPIHYHTDIEFVYVLKGEIQLKNGYYTYHLRAGDVFTNSGNEVHCLKALTPDNVIAQIQVSTRELSQYFPNLSKACYRTYSKKPADKKHERLRELLLQLLLKYELKDFNYKSQCLYLMVDLIKHLDRYFNLFAFDKDMVVGFDRGNALAVERISRICQYVYQNYANNITLQDLSEMEYLSSFYLSHLIKNFTGMNFREFLCFARVEMSEAKLLGTSKKISQIAREVGFSTTAYYRKYFAKWFSYDPQEYRNRFLPEVKSDLNPAVFREVSSSRAISAVRDACDTQNSPQGAGSVVSSLSLDVEVDPDTRSLGTFGRDLSVLVTPEDYSVLGPRLFEVLRELGPARVIMPATEPPSSDEFRHFLSSSGYPVEIRQDYPLPKSGCFPCDSVIYPVYLISRMADGNSLPEEFHLRDVSGSASDPLRGQPSPLTFDGGKKPSFYAYTALSKLRGDIISRGNQHCIVRSPGGSSPVFIIFAYNCNESLYEACQQETGLQETQRLINNYRDEVNLGISLHLRPGQYAVVKYSFNRENNLFAHLSALDFRGEALFSLSWVSMLTDSPSVETYLENVRTVLNLNISLKGPGIQMMLIRACG